MKKNIYFLACLIFCILMTFISCNKQEEETDPTLNVSFGAARNPRYDTLSMASTPATGPLPERKDLTGYFPPPRNQGASGSCVAWAAGYALKSYHERRENVWGYILPDGINLDYKHIISPAYIYNQIKLKGDCGAGSFMDKALEFLQNEGVCTWADMPYNDGDCSTQPTPFVKSKAVYKIKSWKRITPTQIKSFISVEKPIPIVLNVDETFVRGKANVNGNFIWKSYNTVKHKGKHAMIITGYDNDLGAYHVMNSWGVEWANGGSCYIDYNVIHTNKPELELELYVTEDAENAVTVASSAKIQLATNTVSTNIGASSTLYVNVKNVGGQNLNITNLSLENNLTGAFKVGNTVLGRVLYPNESYDIPIIFSPNSLGSFTADLRVSSNATNTDNKIQIRGTGTQIVSLNAPIQIYPAFSTVFSHFPRTLTLAWNSVTNASSYRVEIDYFEPSVNGNSGFWHYDNTGIMLQYFNYIATTNGNTGQQFFYTVFGAGAQPGRWRVWAVDSNGNEGKKSPWSTFYFNQ